MYGQLLQMMNFYFKVLIKFEQFDPFDISYVT